MTILGIWTGVAFFWPEVSVNQTEPLNEDPFSAPFTIENSGNFAITDVGASCTINDEKDARNMNIRNVNEVNYSLPIQNLDAKEKSTIYCKEKVIQLTPPVFADVTLQVSYHPSFTPWIIRRRSFRFRTLQEADTKTRWIPMALSDRN